MVGLIYRLTSKCDGYFYIGSTMKSLDNRMKHHKALLKDPVRCRSPVYTHFNTVGWDNNAEIELIQQYANVARDQLRQYEKDELMKVVDNPLCLNRNRPLRTLEDKKDSDKEYGRIRREQNKDRERERIRQWRLSNPDKWREQTKRYREKKKSIDEKHSS
jgi:hypothetical protein